MTTLHLGCGIRPLQGATNHDRHAHHDYVDIAWDLDILSWPWKDGEFDRIIALDVMEHLKIDVIEWMDECWRILKDGGELVLRVPSFDNPVSWRDITHRRVFHPESLHYFDPRTQLWADYGHFYVDSKRWWHIQRVERVNPPTPTGDLGFVLKKVTE